LGTNTTQYATGDYVRFYVLISDLPKNNIHEIGKYQTTNLGQDSPEISTLSDTLMIPVTEQTLIFYLTSVLNEDNYNFTVAIGMRIWCEDNFPQDSDWWKLLIIKSINLTFSYEKKIDQSTSISWNQIGNKLAGANIDIENATLNFKYIIDQKNWTSSSPNSEIRVYINNRVHTETVKLSKAKETFQDIKVGGFDVTSLILKDVNISVSIQVYLADTFTLNQTITISIDNASLLISYVDNIVETETKLDLFLEGINKTLERSIEV
ncbi:MAG: hypothetical protein HWN79_18920, partial [Candidatus Lokiarchaeota archaeon]|nr:hypothetical protein [Candidatus Lokiarchaeota archaeon]